MATKVNLFPVENGDMTLVKFESGANLLIDVRVTGAADDPDEPAPDVIRLLKERLPRDAEGRPYVTAFLLTHPHADHCLGLEKHFHLGPPGDYPKGSDKILIHETWSSPMVFRRASKHFSICADAAAFCREARRRVRFWRDNGYAGDGNRVLILGEDEGGKTDDLGAILIKVDEVFSRINGAYDSTFTIRLLAPHPKSDDENLEDMRAHNRSSTILNISMSGDGVADRARFLTGGDAEVLVWEALWQRHAHRADWLAYDLLQAPHHCSWHSLSWDSWSQMGEDAKVSADARNSLGQARAGAVIVASSRPVKDDANDPPCIRAKREYQAILRPVSGTFRCVGEEPSERSPDVMEFEVTCDGLRPIRRRMSASVITGGGAIGREPLGHG